MKRHILSLVTGILISHMLAAQAPQILKIREYRKQHENGIIREYVNFLSLPNIAKDTLNIRKNTSFIMDMMNKRGIQKVQLLEARTAGVPPVVYGEVNTPGAKQTIIFYAHYDGQPVNPAQWAKGLDPFTPKLYTGSLDKNGTDIPFPSGDKRYEGEWRIYARSASDDKAGVHTILNTYEAISKSGLKPSVNLNSSSKEKKKLALPTSTRSWTSISRFSNQTSGSSATDRYTRLEKNRLYVACVEIPTWSLRYMLPNGPCIVELMATGHQTRH